MLPWNMQGLDLPHTCPMPEVKVRRIEDEDVEQARGAVRAEVVARYEGLWRLVESHNKLADEGERPPDPRWAEIGVRVLKELTQLYRLNVAPRQAEDEDVWTHGQAPDDVVLRQLEELEERVRAD